jgi:hypothetical protein
MHTSVMIQTESKICDLLGTIREGRREKTLRAHAKQVPVGHFW